MSFRFVKPPRSAPASRFRFMLVRGAVIFAFALLAARLVYVQAVLRTDLQERAAIRSDGHAKDVLIRTLLFE